MILSEISHSPQAFGTSMISNSGARTKFKYPEFQMGDPLAYDKKLANIR